MVRKKSWKKNSKGGKNEEENLRLREPLTFASPKIYQYASKFKPYQFPWLGKLVEVLVKIMHPFIQTTVYSASQISIMIYTAIEVVGRRSAYKYVNISLMYSILWDLMAPYTKSIGILLKHNECFRD